MTPPSDLNLPAGYKARCTTNGAYWLRPSETRISRREIAVRLSPILHTRFSTDDPGWIIWTQVERDAWRDYALTLAAQLAHAKGELV